MSKLLEKGIRAVQSLPEERQDVAGELLLRLAELDQSPRYRPSPEQVAGILEGLAQADRGEFVPDEVMSEFWRKCGL